MTEEEDRTVSSFIDDADTEWVKVGKKWMRKEFAKEFFPSVVAQVEIQEQKQKTNGGNLMTNKPILQCVVSLPKGSPPEPDFGASVGSFFVAKSQTGVARTTKKGKKVYSMAFDITKLKKLIAKYPAIVKKDNRSGNDVVWITGFEGTSSETASSW